MPDNLDEAVNLLTHRIRKITETIPEGSALAFSGGVDSSFLLHSMKRRVVPYTFGLRNSRDITNAVSASKMLGVECRIIEFSSEQVVNAARSVRKIDPEIMTNDLGFETLLYLVVSSIEENVLITGQGADEIFYGYKRFLNSEESNRKGMDKLFQTTLKRELRIAEEFGKKLITPYLDPEILKLADLPKNWHIRDGINKYILRTAASRSGVPDEISFRPKKAAQFGSGTQKVIKKAFKQG